MANPFQRYQSGSFETVPGIAQAGANIGTMLGSGFGNLGANLASGLKQYYENTAKSKAADEEIGVVGQQLMSRQQAYMEASGVDPALIQRYLNDDLVEENGDTQAFAELGKNPMVRYAKQLQPVLDSLKSSPNKGLSSKLSALNSAKASFGMIDEQMKLDDFVAKHRLEQVTNNLPTSVQTTEDVVTPNAIIDPNNPFFANVRKLKKQLQENYPDNPEFVAQGVRKYIEGVKGKYSEQEMTEDQKFEFAGALERYAFGEATDVGEETAYGKVMGEARTSYEQSMADVKAQEAAAEGKPKAGTKKQSSQVEALIAKRDALLKRVSGFDDPKNVEKDPTLRKIQEGFRDKAKADAGAIDVELRNLGVGVDVAEGLKKLAGQAAEERKAPLKLKERLNVLGSEILSEVTDKHLSRIVNGEKVTGMDVLVDITGQDIERNPTSRTVPSNADDWGTGPSKLPEEYTPARKLMEKAMEKLGINPRKPLTADQFMRVKEAAMAGIQTQQETAVKAAEEVTKITPESVTKAATEAVKKAITPQAPAVKSKAFSVGELELGSRLVDVQLNAAEKEAAARDFYSKRFGSVPTGFTQMYRQMFPEASVRMTEVNGVPVMVDGKGNVTVLKTGNDQSNKEIAESKAVTFKNTEIADGVVLDGIFSGTVAGAQDFRKNYAHMANVRSAVDELIKINDMGYESMSPTARARADQLQSEIIAALRIPIVGPGAISEAEQEILQRIVNKGTGIFTLEASERAAIKGLKSRVDREIVNWPKSMGLTVRVGGQQSDVIKQVRMRRLRSQRNLPESN
jgi:hypothetical protein